MFELFLLLFKHLVLFGDFSLTLLHTQLLDVGVLQLLLGQLLTLLKQSADLLLLLSEDLHSLVDSSSLIPLISYGVNITVKRLETMLEEGFFCIVTIIVTNVQLDI